MCKHTHTLLESALLNFFCASKMVNMPKERRTYVRLLAAGFLSALPHFLIVSLCVGGPFCSPPRLLSPSLRLPPQCAGKCRKHTVHKVAQYKAGKASAYAQGRRRYDRKQQARLAATARAPPPRPPPVWPRARRPRPPPPPTRAPRLGLPFRRATAVSPSPCSRRRQRRRRR